MRPSLHRARPNREGHPDGPRSGPLFGSLRRAWPPTLAVDTSLPTWRGRAVRYVAIYLLMVVTLVIVRGATQHIRPDLRAAQVREAELTTQRDTLVLELQALENPQRLRSWAFANGMRRFTDADKVTQAIPPVPSVPAPVVPEHNLEVRTQWR